MRRRINFAMLAEKFGVSVRKVLEAGAGPRLETVHLIPIAEKFILIDAVSEMLKKHERLWPSGQAALVTHNAAIGRVRGTAEFSLPPAASIGKTGKGTGRGFLSAGAVAPVERKRPQARERWPRRIVEVKPLSDFDPGDIDVAVLDLEGGELQALQTMVSRPKILCIEIMPSREAGNSEVMAWLLENDYSVVQSSGFNKIYKLTP